MVRIILGNGRQAIAVPHPALGERDGRRRRRRVGVPRAARYDRAPRMESPMSEAVLVTVVGHVATISLNRAQVHNAFDDALIADLTAALLGVERNPAVRVVVLTGIGASFSAGADLNWMRGMAQASEADNRTDSLRLATLMRTLNFLSKPTIARVNGSAYGGGVGLVACCDVAIG